MLTYATSMTDERLDYRSDDVMQTACNKVMPT